ncbi:MAG TPA: hypothetical protein DDX89_08170, partial [Candidatus Omnitrophica bacterium]|nr:hypothetical protein [Candidatus Omnitrophota bacterium]
MEQWQRSIRRGRPSLVLSDLRALVHEGRSWVIRDLAARRQEEWSRLRTFIGSEAFDAAIQGKPRMPSSIWMPPPSKRWLVFFAVLFVGVLAAWAFGFDSTSSLTPHASRLSTLAMVGLGVTAGLLGGFGLVLAALGSEGGGGPLDEAGGAASEPQRPPQPGGGSHAQAALNHLATVLGLSTDQLLTDGVAALSRLRLANKTEALEDVWSACLNVLRGEGVASQATSHRYVAAKLLFEIPRQIRRAHAEPWSAVKDEVLRLVVSPRAQRAARAVAPGVEERQPVRSPQKTNPETPPTPTPAPGTPSEPPVTPSPAAPRASSSSSSEPRPAGSAAAQRASESQASVRGSDRPERPAAGVSSAASLRRRVEADLWAAARPHHMDPRPLIRLAEQLVGDAAEAHARLAVEEEWISPDKSLSATEMLKPSLHLKAMLELQGVLRSGVPSSVARRRRERWLTLRAIDRLHRALERNPLRPDEEDARAAEASTHTSDDAAESSEEDDDTDESPSGGSWWPESRFYTRYLAGFIETVVPLGVGGVLAWGLIRAAFRDVPAIAWTNPGDPTLVIAVAISALVSACSSALIFWWPHRRSLTGRALADASWTALKYWQGVYRLQWGTAVAGALIGVSVAWLAAPGVVASFFWQRMVIGALIWLPAFWLSVAHYRLNRDATRQAEEREEPAFVEPPEAWPDVSRTSLKARAMQMSTEELSSRDPGTVAALDQLMSGDPAQRIEALNRLVQIDPAMALEALVRAANDQSSAVRAAASVLLDRLVIQPIQDRTDHRGRGSAGDDGRTARMQARNREGLEYPTRDPKTMRAVELLRQTSQRGQP